MPHLLKRKRILMVEDDWQASQRFARSLREEGASVETAATVKEAIARFKRTRSAFDVALIDMYLPLSNGMPDLPGAGIGLADTFLDHCGRHPKRQRPLMIGMSVYVPDFSREALSLRFDAFFDKIDELRGHGLAHFIANQLERPRRDFRLPKIFIVHGHDDKTKLELKNYLQNDLQLVVNCID